MPGAKSASIADAAQALIKNDGQIQRLRQCWQVGAQPGRQRFLDGERRRIEQLTKLGINEFLCKPVSAKSLYDRLLSILLKPRENVKLGNYYGPRPRRPAPAPVPSGTD